MASSQHSAGILLGSFACTQSPPLCISCESCQSQRQFPIYSPCGKAVILQGLSTPLEITPNFDLSPQTPWQTRLLPASLSVSACPLSLVALSILIFQHTAMLTSPDSRALCLLLLWGTVLWLLAWRSPGCPLFKHHTFREVLPVRSNPLLCF